LRFFGGLREAVLKRDRFRCRVCGKGAPLLVHHRDGHNEKRWIPKVLLELWSEIHSGQPFQLQLPFAVPERAADAKVKLARMGEASSQGLFLQWRSSAASLRYRGQSSSADTLV
jgi:hypothetical protein